MRQLWIELVYKKKINKICFDKVLGLDFPSSRMINSNLFGQVNNNFIIKNKSYNKTIEKYYDPILGVDFPNSRFN